MNQEFHIKAINFHSGFAEDSKISIMMFHLIDENISIRDPKSALMSLAEEIWSAFYMRQNISSQLGIKNDCSFKEYLTNLHGVSIDMFGYNDIAILPSKSKRDVIWQPSIVDNTIKYIKNNQYIYVHNSAEFLFADLLNKKYQYPGLLEDDFKSIISSIELDVCGTVVKYKDLS